MINMHQKPISRLLANRIGFCLLSFLLLGIASLPASVFAESELVSELLSIDITDHHVTIDRATRLRTATATVIIDNASDSVLLEPIHAAVNITSGDDVDMPDALGGPGEGPYGTFYIDVGVLTDQQLDPGEQVSFQIKFVYPRTVTFAIDYYAEIEEIVTDPDSDGDGVPDHLDECPDTPVGSTINADGCSDAQIDSESPVVSITTVPESTTASSVLVEGTATDNIGVESLSISNDQFPGTSFSINYDGALWNVNIPLAIGENIIAVTAVDALQNSASESVIIERIQPQGLANLVIESPSDGAIIESSAINVSGTLTSQQAYNSLSVEINGNPVSLQDTADTTVKRFQYANLPLQEGPNQIIVDAVVDYELYDDETLQQSITVTYVPDQQNVPPPTLSVLSPVNNSYVNARSFYLTLHYQSYAGDATITVNGENIDLVTPEAGTVNVLLEFPENQQQWQINATLVDGIGQQQNVSANLFYDGSAPVIVVNNNLQPLPVENVVDEQPYVLSGTVSDTQLADFKINEQTVSLIPTADPAIYQFSVPVEINLGQPTNLHLVARDYSGSTTSVEYSLVLNSAVSLNMLLPPNNVALLNNGQVFNIQVAASINGIVDDYTGRGRILQGSSTIAESVLNVGEGLVSGYINTALSAGNYTVEIALLNNDVLLTKTSRNLIVNNATEVPLRFEKIEPANGETGLETNSPVTLYFNKAINPSLLEVKVKETAHGFSYINTDAAGTQGFESKGYRLVKVDIDDEPVSGGISVLPGSSVIAFYPSREFAYDSQVEVIVEYDGEEKSRSRFKTRELPSFVDGSVLDQFAQPVAGVKVELVELTRATQTNASGVFGFGYGDKAAQRLPDGRYTVRINAGMENTTFGTLEKKIFVNTGEVTDLGNLILPALNTQDAFSHFASGADVILARGDLKINASDAEVFFPDGKKQGLTMALFLPLGSFSHSYDPMFMPYWLFSLQPMGIEVEGALEIDFALAKSNLIDDYVWADGAYILLLGLDAEKDMVVPSGVGIVENHRVKSLRHAYSRLDYIGYAPMPDQAFPFMQAYANGEMSLETMVTSIRNLFGSVPADGGAQQ